MRVRRTSLLAYTAIKNNGLLSKRRWETYGALYEHGPVTASELCQKAGVTGLWKRLSELKQFGLVMEVGQRTCAVTGMTATLWDVTDHIPAEFVRPKSRIQILKETLLENAEQPCLCASDRQCHSCFCKGLLGILKQKKDVA